MGTTRRMLQETRHATQQSTAIVLGERVGVQALNRATDAMSRAVRAIAESAQNDLTWTTRHSCELTGIKSVPITEWMKSNKYYGRNGMKGNVIVKLIFVLVGLIAVYGFEAKNITADEACDTDRACTGDTSCSCPIAAPTCSGCFIQQGSTTCGKCMKKQQDEID